MFETVGFLAGAVALLLIAPKVLTAGRWQVRFPRTALTLWFLAFLAGFGALAASIAFALISAIQIRPAGPVLEAIVASILAWGGLAAVGALVTFVLTRSEPVLDSHRSTSDALRLFAGSEDSGSGVVLARFSSREPIAFAVRGEEPTIFLSSGLEEALRPAEVRAVVAHERAHLQGRHDLAMRIAEVNAKCIPPRLAAGRDFKRATALLIELVADDAAALSAGPANLANALAKLGTITEDPGLELRADRLTLRRWPSSRGRQVPSLATAAHRADPGAVLPRVGRNGGVCPAVVPDA